MLNPRVRLWGEAVALLAVSLWLTFDVRSRQAAFNYFTLATSFDLQNIWDPPDLRPLEPRRIGLLALDLDGNGVQLIGISDSAMNFDFDGTGFAKRSGWVAQSDGVLVQDVDGDGKIDALPDWFGLDAPGRLSKLKDFDTNRDGILTPEDNGWMNFRVWQTSNVDGEVSYSLLRPLEEVGITAIALEERPVGKETDGNFVRSALSLTLNGKPSVAEIVYMEVRDHLAVFFPPKGFVMHPDTEYLPKLSGGGGTPNLSYSMTVDNQLHRDVKELVEKSWYLPMFMARGAAEKIIWRWTRADEVLPGSRGPYIDARSVHVIEAFAGMKYPVTRLPPPTARLASEYYKEIVDWLTALMMMQTYNSYQALKGYRDPHVAHHAYSLVSGQEIDPKYNSPRFSRWSQWYSSTGYLCEWGPPSLPRDCVEAVKGYRRDQKSSNAMEVSRILSSRYRNWPSFLANLQSNLYHIDYRFPPAGYIYALMMSGLEVEDIVFGSRQDDVLILPTNRLAAFGDDGDDSITGNEKDNVLIGGRGRDVMLGGTGDDTYIWNPGDGDDVIIEPSQGTGERNDRLILNHVQPSNVIFSNSAKGLSLMISYSAKGAASTILLDTPQANDDRGIETIIFNGVEWNKEAILKASKIDR